MFPYRRLPSHITGLYLFTVANFVLLCHMALVQGDITVKSVQTNQTVFPNIPDMPAYFGVMIPGSGIQGQVVYSNPPNACSPIDAPPNVSMDGSPAGQKWIVLIRRNDCSFSQKVLNAQRAGYAAAIIHNVNSDQLEPMGPSQNMVIGIPSVFVGETNGLLLRKLYTYDKGFFVFIDDEFPDMFWPFSLDKYLLPFAVMLVICFMATICTLVFKCIRDRRHRLRHRLPTRLLNKLPIKKFKKGDQYDTCAICLDDYREGEKLRLLPCSHTYHTKCIDPWLTENRRNCPVCKRKVLFGTRRERHRTTSSDSDSGDDGGGSSGGDDGRRGVAAPTENTPLLNSGYGTVYGSGNSALMAEDVSHDDGDAWRQEPGRADDSDDDDGWQSHRPRNASASPASAMSSQQSSPDGHCQSFATPRESPILVATMAAAAAMSSSRMPFDALLPAPVVIARRDLISSGEHSVNGEFVDFSPIQQPATAARIGSGPVEIAIDVAAREPAAAVLSPSLFGTLPSVSRDGAVPAKGQDMVV